MEKERREPMIWLLSTYRRIQRSLFSVLTIQDVPEKVLTDDGYVEVPGKTIQHQSLYQQLSSPYSGLRVMVLLKPIS